jgi:hypothetical protein|tara:strand:- start:544 stop:768 length:225 start_codon:yes stop_codon:yes gene_type:complete
LEKEKGEGIMSNLRVTIRDDSGNECPIEIIRTFRKHLQLFHKKGVSIHDENGHYFTVDDSFRQKIDAMVRKLSG